MKKWLLVLICFCCILTACDSRKEPEDQQTVETVQSGQSDMTLPGEQESVSIIPTWAEEIVPPEEMPSAPEADAEIPPQPQPTVISK